MTILGSLWRGTSEPGSGPFARTHQGGPSSNKPNIVAVIFGLIALAAFSALYVLHRETYFAVIDWWSFHPFAYPFLDLFYVSSQVECWRQGIDVYVQNPCDPLGRVQDYSPLWLRLSFLASAKSFINPLGLSLDGLFILSLAVLPRPRQRIDYLPLLLCVISPMTVFALERGNNDVLMFILAMAAVVCMNRAVPVRILGYGLIMLAGVLKLYPFVLFMLLLRERPRVFLAGAVVAVCGIGGFTWFYLDELGRMAANIPRPSPFSDAFGSVQLPIGMNILLWNAIEYTGFGGAVVAGWSSSMIPARTMYVLLLVGASIMVRYLTRRNDLQAAMRALSQRESLCLIAGAALVCGCFFSGRSIGYREIMLLMVLPGLTALARSSPARALARSSPARALARSSPARALARTLHATTWVAVFLMMSPGPQRFINDYFGDFTDTGVSLPAFGFWLFRELCWWGLATVLIAILVRFVLDSPMWSATRGLSRGHHLEGLTEEPVKPRQQFRR
jgi:hypothetical protein